MSKNLTEKQKNKIASSAISLVSGANDGVSPYRQVSVKSALTIVERSLSKTNKLPFSIREYLAVRDVSDFISVSQKNKTNLNKRRNTDLLPVCHPASTKPHAMTASALRAEKGKWISGDPRIISEEAKSLIASAFVSDPFSAEETYYLTRISALPQGSVPLTAIVAAFGDGNSRAARSMRARLQRRDRRGRFAWQGGGMSTLVRRRNGAINRLTGRTISQGVGNDDTFDVELPDGRIARVPAKSSEASRAYREDPNAPEGFSPIEAESVASTPTVNEQDLVVVDSPNGFRQQQYDGAGTQYTDDAYNVTKLDSNDPDQMEEIPDEFFTRDVQGNSPIDDNKPVYIVTRDDGTPVTSWDEGPMQSWSDVQDAIRVDEIVRDKQEGREPDPIGTLDEETLARVADIAEEQDRDPYDVVSEILGKQVSPPTEARPDSFEITEFRDPTGMMLVDDAETYIAEGRDNQKSEDYTDDPSVLAQMFSEEELSNALREAVTPQANRAVPEEGDLPFSAGNEKVPAQALYDALKEQGANAPEIMQGIYDDIDAPSEKSEEAPEAKPAPQKEITEESLRERMAQWAGRKKFGPDYSRAISEDLGRAENEIKKGDLEGANYWLDEIDKYAKKYGIDPLPESAEKPGEVSEGKYEKLPDLFDGLTDEEKQSILEGGDYKQYLPENQEFDAPEGYQPMFSEPFENVEENLDFDPINLANNFETEDLKEALAEALGRDADRPGYGTVGRIDEDGEESFTTAPIASIRDALQMQGEDTNSFIESIYQEGRESDAQEAADALKGILEEQEEEPETGLGTETRTDGTTSTTITAPNGKTYSVGTRKNKDGGVDLVMSDSEGREFIESSGEENELEDLNNQAAEYAKSIRDGDEIGEAFAELIDAEEISERDEEPEPEVTPEPEPEPEPITTPEVTEGGEEKEEEEEEEPTPEIVEEEPTPTPEFVTPKPPITIIKSKDANGDTVWSFTNSDGRKIDVVAQKNPYTGTYSLLMREQQEDGSILEYNVLDQLELNDALAELASRDLAMWMAKGKDFRDYKYEKPESLPETPIIPEGNDQGRTPPNPETGTPSKIIVPDKDIFHVDGEGDLVLYTPEYINYLLSSDPSDLTNEELNDLIEIINQMPSSYSKMYEGRMFRAQQVQIQRVLGVPEPVSSFSGEKFSAIPEGVLPSDIRYPGPSGSARSPRRPRRPGSYFPGDLPPLRPRPPEYPLPDETKKGNLNRRARNFLAAIEKLLNEMLDYRMPDSFYPNLPQSERERLFNDQLANLEQALENIRIALRNYIKTKDGSENNQQALDDLAAQIDFARRRLTRLERGGFRGIRGEERDPSLVAAEDALNELSDWIEDAIDPEWSPEIRPSVSQRDVEPRRPFTPEAEDIDSRRPEYNSDTRFFDDLESRIENIDIESLSDEEAVELTSKILRDIANSMPLYGNVNPNSPYLEPEVIGKSPEALFLEEEEAKRYFAQLVQEAVAKAEIADAWEKENEGESFDFSNDKLFRNILEDSSPILNPEYLQSQLSELIKLLGQPGSDPERIAYLANSLQPVFNPKNPDPRLDGNPLVQRIRSNEKIAEIVRKGLAARGVSIDADDPVETFKPKTRTRKPSLPRPKVEPSEGEAEKPKKPSSPRKITPKITGEEKDVTPKQAKKDRDEKEEAEPAVLGPDGERFYEAEVPDIDLDFSEEDFPPNDEQEAIVRAGLTRVPLLVVRALAGTGKSTTLRMIARQWLKRDPSFSILNLSFNKSVQAQARKTMPENVRSSTADSLANSSLKSMDEWSFMVDRLNANNQKKYKGTVLYRRADIATHFGVENLTINQQEVGFTEVVRMAENALHEYAISSDDNLEAKHFKNFENPESVPPELLDLARKMWADKNDPEGALRVNHEDIFKRFALLKPNLRVAGPGRAAFDMIFVDEAQDLNPVFSKLVLDQEIPIIMVGDSNQAIYAFRGAVDELNKVTPNIDLPLTQSYRFGAQIAQIGNRFLSLINSPFRVRGAGGPSRIVKPGSMEDPDAIITRTTIGKVAAALESLKRGKKVAMDQNSRLDLIEFVSSIKALRFGNLERVTHSDLRGYSSWRELLQDIESGTAGSKAKQLFRYASTKEGMDELSKLSRDVKFPFVEGLTAETYIPEISTEEITSGEVFVPYLYPSQEKFVSKDQKEKARQDQLRKYNERKKKAEEEGKKFEEEFKFTAPRGKQSSVPMNMISQKNEDGSISVYLWSNLLGGNRTGQFLFDVRRVGFTELIKRENHPSNSPVPKISSGVSKGQFPKVTSRATFVGDENGTAEENAARAINDLRSSLQGVLPEETDVTIITAHVSKGLEFDRVQISDDFSAERFSPQRDPETGQVILPDDEELRLAYVAVTRAKDELDPGGLSWVFDYTTERDADSPQKESAEEVVSDIDGNIKDSFSSLFKNAALNPEFYLSKSPETSKKVLEAKKRLPGADVEEIDRIISLIDAASAPKKPTPTVEQKAENDRQGFETLNGQIPESERYEVPSQKDLEADVAKPIDINVARIEQEIAIDNLGDGQWQIWKKDIPSPDGKKVLRYEIVVQKNRGNTFSVLHRVHDVTNEGKSTRSTLVNPVVINSYPASDGYRYLKTLSDQSKAELALALSKAPRTAEGQANAVREVFSRRSSLDIPQERIDNPAATHISADGFTDIRELFENSSPGQKIRVYDHVRGEWGYLVKILDSYHSYGYSDYVKWLPDGENRQATQGPAKNLFVVDEATGAWTPTEGISVPDFYKGERRVPVSPPINGYDDPPIPTKVKQDVKLDPIREEQRRKELARRARAAGRRPDSDEAKEPISTPRSGESTPTRPTPVEEDFDEEEGSEADAEAAAQALLELLNGVGDDDSAGADEGPIPGGWTRSDKEQFLGETREKFAMSVLGGWSASGYLDKVKEKVIRLLPKEIMNKISNKQALDKQEKDLIMSGIEAEIASTLNSIVEEAMRIKVGKPSRIYKSNRGSTVAVSARGVSQGQIDYFLDTVDRLESLVSIPNMTYIISNKLSSEDGVMGSTVISDHIMFIRPSNIVEGGSLDSILGHRNWRAEKVYGSNYSPVTSDTIDPQMKEAIQEQFDSINREDRVSGLLSLMLHEMGHAVDRMHAIPSSSAPGDKTLKTDAEFYGSQNPEGLKALIAYANSSSAGTYAKSEPGEAYAEAFSHWVISGGKPLTPEVAAVAEAFDWPGRFPSVGKILSRPEDYAPTRPAGGVSTRNITSEADTSYRMQHSAPNRDYGASADNLEEIMPDFYSRPELYRTGDTVSDRESLAALEKIKGDPDAMVTVYRSAPEGSTINPGDWVSLSETYARQHGFGETEDQDMPVFSMEVRAGDLFTDGNSINEFGWDPESGSPEKDSNLGELKIFKEKELKIEPYEEAALSPTATKKLETLEERQKKSRSRLLYPTTLRGMSRLLREEMREGMRRIGVTNYRDMDRNIESVLLRAWPNLDGKTAEKALADDSPEPDGLDWYGDAGREAERIGQQYGLSRYQVAALIAATSPREPWHTNSAIGEYIAKAISEDHEVQIDALLETMAPDKGVPLYFDLKSSVEDVTKDGEARIMPSPEELRGKKLSELDPYVAAAIIRAHAKIGYRTENVGGADTDGNPINLDGQPLRAFNSETNVFDTPVWNAGVVGSGRAVRIAREEAPDLMLNGHKVRSFFNNIAGLENLDSPGNVTVDSHALAVALGYKLSSSSPEYVIFTGGMQRTAPGIRGYYAPVADAYRRIAQKYGLEPWQVQALTWVQWRKEFGGERS